MEILPALRNMFRRQGPMCSEPPLSVYRLATPPATLTPPTTATPLLASPASDTERTNQNAENTEEADMTTSLSVRERIRHLEQRTNVGDGKATSPEGGGGGWSDGVGVGDSETPLKKPKRKKPQSTAFDQFEKQGFLINFGQHPRLRKTTTPDRESPTYHTEFPGFPAITPSDTHRHTPSHTPAHTPDTPDNISMELADYHHTEASLGASGVGVGPAEWHSVGKGSPHKRTVTPDSLASSGVGESGTRSASSASKLTEDTGVWMSDNDELSQAVPRTGEILKHFSRAQGPKKKNKARRTVFHTPTTPESPEESSTDRSDQGVARGEPVRQSPQDTDALDISRKGIEPSGKSNSQEGMSNSSEGKPFLQEGKSYTHEIEPYPPEGKSSSHEGKSSSSEGKSSGHNSRFEPTTQAPTTRAKRPAMLQSDTSSDSSPFLLPMRTDTPVTTEQKQAPMQGYKRRSLLADFMRQKPANQKHSSVDTSSGFASAESLTSEADAVKMCTSDGKDSEPSVVRNGFGRYGNQKEQSSINMQKDTRINFHNNHKDMDNVNAKNNVDKNPPSVVGSFGAEWDKHDGAQESAEFSGEHTFAKVETKLPRFKDPGADKEKRGDNTESGVLSYRPRHNDRRVFSSYVEHRSSSQGPTSSRNQLELSPNTYTSSTSIDLAKYLIKPPQKDVTTGASKSKLPDHDYENVDGIKPPKRNAAEAKMSDESKKASTTYSAHDKYLFKSTESILNHAKSKDNEVTGLSYKPHDVMSSTNQTQFRNSSTPTSVEIRSIPTHGSALQSGIGARPKSYHFTSDSSAQHKHSNKGKSQQLPPWSQWKDRKPTGVIGSAQENADGLWDFHTNNPLGESDNEADDTQADESVVAGKTTAHAQHGDQSDYSKSVSHPKGDGDERGSEGATKKREEREENKENTEPGTTPARPQSSQPLLSGFFANSSPRPACNVTDPHEFQLVRATYRPSMGANMLAIDSSNHKSIKSPNERYSNIETNNGLVYGCNKRCNAPVNVHLTGNDTSALCPDRMHIPKRNLSDQYIHVHSKAWHELVMADTRIQGSEKGDQDRPITEKLRSKSQLIRHPSNKHQPSVTRSQSIVTSSNQGADYHSNNNNFLPGRVYGCMETNSSEFYAFGNGKTKPWRDDNNTISEYSKNDSEQIDPPSTNSIVPISYTPSCMDSTPKTQQAKHTTRTDSSSFSYKHRVHKYRPETIASTPNPQSSHGIDTESSVSGHRSRFLSDQVTTTPNTNRYGAQTQRLHSSPATYCENADTERANAFILTPVRLNYTPLLQTIATSPVSHDNEAEREEASSPAPPLPPKRRSGSGVGWETGIDTGSSPVFDPQTPGSSGGWDSAQKCTGLPYSPGTAIHFNFNSTATTV